MAFQKVGNGNFKYVKYAECEAGQVLATGTYLGEKQGTYGIQHQIRDDKGDVTVLNSSGHLNFLMANHVSKGDYIQVTYTGTEEMKKGKYKGKEMHQFEVGVDSDRARDTGATVQETPAKSAAEDDDDDLGEEEDSTPTPPPAKRVKQVEEAEEDTVQAPPPVKAATPVAAKAKEKLSSDELLAKYRGKKGA